jgi:hypothetical protein
MLSTGRRTLKLERPRREWKLTNSPALMRCGLGISFTRATRVARVTKKGRTDASQMRIPSFWPVFDVMFFIRGALLMGHTRLGELPKTRKWNEVVELMAGSGLSGDVAAADSYIDAIAWRTLDASQKNLKNAVNDSGVLYTFYLLIQVALASRTANWENALAQHDIHLASDSTVFDLTAELQAAIDRHIGRTTSGATDLSEMAQQSAGEALLSLAGMRTVNPFGGSSADVRNAVRSFSTKKGFGELGQGFFGRFLARYLNFYLSRVTAGNLGSPRLQDLGGAADFNQALQVHCIQSARIVRNFCGEWYSKTAYQEGINLENTSRFFAVAIGKLRSELAQQGGES